MKPFALISIMLLFQWVLLGQKNQLIYPDNFNSIQIVGNFNVYLIQDTLFKIEFKGNQNDINNIKIDVINFVLKISSIKSFKRKPDLMIIVHFPKINSILSTGGNNFFSTKYLKLDSIHIILSSGSVADIKLESHHTTITVDKGSTISLNGKSKFADIESSTRGIFNGYEFRIDSAIARSNTGGLIKIFPIKFMEAYAAAGGEISYRGQPIIQQKTSLGGKISKVAE